MSFVVDNSPEKVSRIRVRYQGLASPLVLHLFRAAEQGFEVAELLQQLDGPLPADPLHSRYVVRRISHQREIVRHLRRSYAESFGGVRLVHPMLLDSGAAAAAGIEQCDAGSDELIEIFVSRY